MQRCNAPLILASSKTAAEISALRHELNATKWPSIVENGAGILPAGATDLHGGGEYEIVREALAALPPDLCKHFTGFRDLAPAALADLTGLSIDSAKLAQTRRFSGPGQWHGSEDQKAAFLAELAESGIKAQQGGRFLTLSLGKNKVDQMHHIIQHYAPKHTVALGDAPNDVAMLEAADFGIIIAYPNRDPLTLLNGEDTDHIARPAGLEPSHFDASRSSENTIEAAMANFHQNGNITTLHNLRLAPLRIWKTNWRLSHKIVKYRLFYPASIPGSRVRRCPT